MVRAANPTARALLALEAIQNTPGITAEALGRRLGVTERAARRYVSTLREADLPIESETGPYGGYRVGRGLRLAPLMLTPAEALGLVMATLEGHRAAAEPDDPVGAAIAKLVRVLPRELSEPVRTAWEHTEPPGAAKTRPDPELTSHLVLACTGGRRLHLEYRIGRKVREMEVDPWAVVLRHSRWYLLCWSHTADAQRVLRVDRVVQFRSLPEESATPHTLDALRELESHLAQGWPHEVDVIIDVPLNAARYWVRRSLGELEPVDEHRTRLRGSTNSPEWYARQLATIEVPWHVLGSAVLREAVDTLIDDLRAATQPLPDVPPP